MQYLRQGNHVQGGLNVKGAG